MQKLKADYLKEEEQTMAAGKLPVIKERRESRQTTDNGIIVKGIDNCLVRFARCCNPVPGDMIVGYVTRGRGVSVHRADCPNVKAMEDYESRAIDVRWAGAEGSVYSTLITVKAFDRANLLLDLAAALSELKLNMRAINARTTRDNYDLFDITVEISERDQLDKLIKKLRRIDSVVEVSRTAN